MEDSAEYEKYPVRWKEKPPYRVLGEEHGSDNQLWQILPVGPADEA